MLKEGAPFIIAAFGATVLLLMLSRSLSCPPLRYLGWASGLVTVLLANHYRKAHGESPEARDE
jgi:hypothetical protein